MGILTTSAGRDCPHFQIVATARDFGEIEPNVEHILPEQRIFQFASQGVAPSGRAAIDELIVEIELDLTYRRRRDAEAAYRLYPAQGVEDAPVAARWSSMRP